MPKLSDLLKEEFAQRIARGDCSKRDAYLQARLVCGIETQISADAAGVNASRLLKDSAVRARVDELLKGELAKIETVDRVKLEKAAARSPRLVETIALTREWVIERLIDNVNRAMTAVPVLDNEGEPTGEWKYNGQVANKALELLGKECGMFATVIKSTVTHIDAEQLSDDELTNIAAGRGESVVATKGNPTKPH